MLQHQFEYNMSMLGTSRKYVEIGQSFVFYVTDTLGCEKDITMKVGALAAQIMLWPGKYTIIYFDNF